MPLHIIISNHAEKPIYEQIVSQIEKCILAGELSGGDMLPSIRSLAKDLRISVITTKRAYEELEKEGYAYTVPGKGSYVKNKSDGLIKEEILKTIENHVSKAILTAKQYNIDKEDVLEVFAYLYEEENSGK